MAVGIGDALRQARERAGVRLADASAETRIRQAHLRALEDEDFAVIGGDVYVKGFIRSYARHLGIDPQPLIEAYRAHHEVPDGGVTVTTDAIDAPPPPRRPITTIVVVLALLTIGGLAVLGVLVPDAEDGPDEPSAPDPVASDPLDGEDDSGGEGGTDEDPDPGAVAGEDGDGEVQAGGEGGQSGGEGGEEDSDGDEDPDGDELPAISEEVVLRFSVQGGNSWARVTVDGERVEEATLQSGYSEVYTGDEVFLRVGNAGSVQIEVNGEDLGVIGDGGQVVDVRCSTAAGECEIG